MPMTLIKGEYRVVGAAPDGDSIRFYPDAADAWERAGLNVRPNAAGGAQLRLEGIDALETHYTPAVGDLRNLHQPHDLGRAAAAELLRLLGFEEVVRRDDEVVTSATPATRPGHIYTRFADKYGRAVAFAYAGTTDQPDLAAVFLDAAALAGSVNQQLLASGLEYPTYYSKLFVDLRAALNGAVEEALTAGRGVWPDDVTMKGVTVDSLATLTDVAVVLPKLFRRLVDYLSINNGDVSLAGLPAYLASRDDRLVVVSTGQITGFDNVLVVDGQTVRMTRPPEDLVFIEG
jgi:endonuclease YncB( thermonuclease family)